MRTGSRALIVGGGIGGLTAALCLAKAGFRVAVFEQAQEFLAIGAGIQLSPNCTRVLHHLGLAQALANQAVVPQATEFRSWNTAKLIHSIPLGEAVRQRYGFPYYHMHRGDLLNVLVGAARQSPSIDLYTGAPVEQLLQHPVRDQPDIDPHAGTPVEKFHQPPAPRPRDTAMSRKPLKGLGFKDQQHTPRTQGTVAGASSSATFQDTGPVQITVGGNSLAGDVLVGADGIHSRVRALLFGEQPATFTGHVAWRALVPTGLAPQRLRKPVGTVWWGPGRHVVCYLVRGGTHLNCVFVVEKSGWEVESWTERGEYAELKSDFTGWHPDIQALIDGAPRDSLYKWALHDRPPMPRWGRGAVTLLGDACHPTLPFQAQGAAIAIEDAAVLANCLSSNADIETALQRYETLRRARTASVQTSSRRNARVFHLSGVMAWLRNRATKQSGHRAAHKLFAYDALSVS